MIFRKTDIYFAADDSHRFLPWLIGIMVFLACLLLCLGVSVGGWVIERSDTYANSFTVNIPAHTENMDQAVEATSKILRSMEGISSIRRIPTAELQDMLEPWLGSNSASSAELPLPAVLEVTLRDDPRPELNYDRIQSKLQNVTAGVEVDAHEMWIAAFSNFSSAMQSLTIILAVLIIGGMSIMISFTSRAALKLHSRTVQLLHSIGAEDRYVSRQFQLEALRLVLPGAIAGCAMAGIAYFLAGLYIDSLDTSIMPSLSITNGHYALLFVMPVACTLVAWFVARYSVIRQLERSL